MLAGVDPSMRSIGILGGTFDPIHHGHLRLAVELRERLDLGEVRLIPNALPPHRGAPGAHTGQRVRWIHEAVAGEPGLRVDERELIRGGKSYTVDTLISLREEFPHTPLCLILGMDTFLGLQGWHRWTELSGLAHIVLAPRPGVRPPATGVLGEFLSQHRVSRAQDLQTRPSGLIYQCDITPLPISSTRIRELLQAGRSVRYLVPDVVWRDLGEDSCYRVKTDDADAV